MGSGMDATQPARDRRRRVGMAAGLAFLLAGSAAYFAWPRPADLAAFDPDAMARLETQMWRDYYGKQYAALSRHLYAVSREQYGFSPLDSIRIAFEAALAAYRFQPSTSRAEAEAALPSLNEYFRLLAPAARVRFDVHDAAGTELAWWQARREAVKPENYGLIIARVATLVYGVDGDDMRRSGVVRAQAMAYRDARGDKMQADDWMAIEDRLRLAYGLLKRALSPPVR